MDVEKKIEDSVGGMGFDLVDVERPVNGSGLRVFIDKQGGVSIDDCVMVSNQLNRVLDVEQFSYDQLEVSSPGDDRRLRTVADFQKFQGSKVKFKLRYPIDELVKIRGIINRVDDGDLLVSVDGGEMRLPIASIEMARLIPMLGLER